ncbi:hypothetical protein G7070_01245 [Propioniciclava coleopterorum]|uniref:Uncharacterized protein n=1 Tax=Propioniciclava coleopterorum TaxID=2714937 RepID=A0A6G7Y2V0_9ACTN|nr:hypothetical protein [Propioniciclava coleopterorum]QIK71160.1 hypothetical protein G7070_01245 [Propioniciclava coleopterorum]
MPGIEVVLAALVVIAVIGQLERTERRMRALPRAPLGADEDSLAIAEYRRELRELREVAQRADQRARTGERFNAALRHL